MISTMNKYGPPAAAVAVFLALALFVLAGAYTYRQQNKVDRKLCWQTVENRAATRLTWRSARSIVLRGQHTEEGRARTNQFFQAILENIPPLQCIDNKPVVKEVR